VGIEEGMGITDVRVDEPDKLQSKIIFPVLFLDCIRTILRNQLRSITSITAYFQQAPSCTFGRR
jgi:hypothetical protein